MAQAGVYSPGAVITAELTVRVNGVVRQVESVDFAGDTTGGLPDQVVSAGTGMRSRTGTIRWAAQAAVEIEPPHPLRQRGGWPPREGDRVQIDATVDTGSGPYSWRRFTGRLGRTTGSLIDGTLTSVITDTIGDRLHRPVTVDPAIRRDLTAPSSWTVGYRAIEVAHLGHLPPPDGDTVLHFTGQADTLPARGDLLVQAPVFNDYLWGQWVRTTRLTPTQSQPGARDLLLIARGGLRYTAWAQIVLSDWSVLRITCTPAGEMSVMWGGVRVWSGQWSDAEAPVPVLAVQVRAKDVLVWTSRTQYVSVPVVVPRPLTVREVGVEYTSGVAMRFVEPSKPAPVVASVPPRPLSWAYSETTMQTRRATRGVENVPARAVVDAWGDSTLTALWMDEHGTPIARPREVLVAGSVARSLRVDERVFAGTWSLGDDQMRSSVVVKGEQGLVQQSRGMEYRVTAWQENSARGFDAVESVERFIEAPSEQDWGPIQTQLRRAGSQSVGGELEGSWVAAVVVLSGENVERWAQTNGVTYRVSVERLGQRTLKVTEWVDALPGGSTVYTRMPTENTNVHPALRGETAPIVRAQWVSTWADYTVTGAATGPAWAPALELDVGWWLTPSEAQSIADALSAEVTKPMPTLSGVEVLWDPTRQIGDVEEWTAVDRDGSPTWTARVLVVGYSETWDGSAPSQSVDVRVISWTDPSEGKTYADLAAAYPTYGGMSGTYQQIHDALPSAR